MSRKKNSTDTYRLTLSTSQLNRQYLETLVEHGNFGRTAADVAERFVSERLRQLCEGDSTVAESLDKTFREFNSAIGRESRRVETEASEPET